MSDTSVVTESGNPQNEKLEALKNLFPEAFSEGKLNPTILAKTLGEDSVSNEKEVYGMTWAGKSDARKQILAPTTKTLTRNISASENFENTGNILIEGDNLEVLKLLQKSYGKQIKMIYIDPPYNTGKDFVYRDNFTSDRAEYEASTGQRDSDGNRLVQNTETNGRYHSDWLSMMYPRLHLARNLLREDGVIFVSIDDHEVHNLRKIMDEIFGEENFLGMFVINSSPSAIDYGHIGKMHEYAVFYARNVLETTTEQLPEKEKKFKYTDELGGFNISPLYNGNVAFNPSTRPNLYYPFYLNPEKTLENGFYEIGVEKQDGWIEVYPVVSEKDGIQRVWRWGKPKAKEGANKEIVGYKNESGEFRIVQKTRIDAKVIRSLQLDTEVGSRRGTGEMDKLFGKKVFTFPKPPILLERYIKSGSGDNTDAIILDFFAGSGTTGHAVMALNAEEKAEAVKNGTNPDEVGNRRYICVQLPEPTDVKSEAHKAGYETISEITAERLRRAGKKIREENPDISLDTGFRLYTLEDSCYQVANIDYRSEDSQQTLESLEKAIQSGLSPLREGAKEADVMVEILLKEGFPLTTEFDTPVIGENVWNHAEYEGKQLYICFEGDIAMSTIQALGKEQSEAIFVVYDYALDDSRKVMLASRVKLRTI